MGLPQGFHEWTHLIIGTYIISRKRCVVWAPKVSSVRMECEGLCNQKPYFLQTLSCFWLDIKYSNVVQWTCNVFLIILIEDSRFTIRVSSRDPSAPARFHHRLNPGGTISKIRPFKLLVEANISKGLSARNTVQIKKYPSYFVGAGVFFVNSKIGTYVMSMLK